MFFPAGKAAASQPLKNKNAHHGWRMPAGDVMEPEMKLSAAID
jgi:hypothetical protein